MNFKLDENMPRDLANFLKKEGHDVKDVVEEGLAGHKDPSVLLAATAEDRVLLTFDLDFADIRNFPPGTNAGIVVFRLHDQRWKTLEPSVRHLLELPDLAKLEKGLAIVDESSIRFRPFRKK